MSRMPSPRYLKVVLAIPLEEVVNVALVRLADSKLRHVVQEMDQTSEYYPKRPAGWLEKTSFPRGHTQKERSVGFQLCRERQRQKEGERDQFDELLDILLM